MKKVIILVVLAVVILLGGALTYLGVNAQKLASNYKPDIEKAISKALKTHVELGEVSVSVFPNVTVGFSSLLVSRQKHAEENLTLQGLTLDVDTFALLSGKFVIDVFSIANPNITLIKEKGATWIQGLPRQEKSKQPIPVQAKGEVSRDKGQTTGGAVPGALAFALNAFKHA